MAKKKEETVEQKAFRVELIERFGQLATGGLGLVAALAWNDAIQAFVKGYIEVYIPGAGIYSKFLYATVVTVLIVLITYQTSMLAARFRRPKT